MNNPQLSFTTKNNSTAKNVVELCQQVSELCAVQTTIKYYEAVGSRSDLNRAEYLRGDMEHRLAIISELLGKTLKSAFPTEAEWEKQLWNLQADIKEQLEHQKFVEKLHSILSPDQRNWLQQVFYEDLEAITFIKIDPVPENQP